MSKGKSKKAKTATPPPGFPLWSDRRCGYCGHVVPANGPEPWSYKIYCPVCSRPGCDECLPEPGAAMTTHACNCRRIEDPDSDYHGCSCEGACMCHDLDDARAEVERWQAAHLESQEAGARVAIEAAALRAEVERLRAKLVAKVDAHDVDGRALIALRAQIDMLAKYLLEECGGPTQDESACEMAVRVLRELRAEVKSMRGEYNILLAATNEHTDGLGGCFAQRDALRAEVERLRAEACRWYRADGSYDVADPEEIVARRKAAAVELATLAALRTANARLVEALRGIVTACHLERGYDEAELVCALLERMLDLDVLAEAVMAARTALEAAKNMARASRWGDESHEGEGSNLAPESDSSCGVAPATGHPRAPSQDGVAAGVCPCCGGDGCTSDGPTEACPACDGSGCATGPALAAQPGKPVQIGTSANGAAPAGPVEEDERRCLNCRWRSGMEEQWRRMRGALDRERECNEELLRFAIEGARDALCAALAPPAPREEAAPSLDRCLSCSEGVLDSRLGGMCGDHPQACPVCPYCGASATETCSELAHGGEWRVRLWPHDARIAELNGDGHE